MKYTTQKTALYNKWFSKLRDTRIKSRIMNRLDLACKGHFGDHKRLADNLFELRFTFGGGLRIYYAIKGGTIILLLAGGDKSSQQKDIAKAKAILERTEE